MPEYLSPGVYVEEIQTGPRAIEGVSTSTGAMLGPTERGPQYPRMVTSWLEYQRWYGGYLPPAVSFLPYAVQGFFDNGGRRLYVARIVDEGATFATSEDAVGGLTISAIGAGDWGNRIFVRVQHGSKHAEDENLFRLTLLYFSADKMPPDPDDVVNPLDPGNASNPDRREPDYVEDYDNLVHTVGAPNNVVTVVNPASQLVRLWFTDDPVPIASEEEAPFVRLSDAAVGDNTTIEAPQYQGDMDEIMPGDPSGELLGRGQGLAAIAAVDEVSLIAVPDEVKGVVQPVTDMVINQCETLADRFAVVSVERGESNEGDVRPPRDTSYAAFYYPWIEIYDLASRGPLRVPPSGHVMGLIARTDIDRGVHKAPANEVVRSATNLEFPVTKGMQDILNPRGVNCIRDFRKDGRGIRLWGARTMSSDPLWKYVNVRRLFLFIEESIEEGTQWVVFEPNDEPLWAQVRRTIAGFLTTVWKSGALMGLTQEEAFFVKCDRSTMTQDDIDNGRLICYIGVAPVKPAEFVIFRISQKTIEATA